MSDREPGIPGSERPRGGYPAEQRARPERPGVKRRERRESSSESGPERPGGAAAESGEC